MSAALIVEDLGRIDYATAYQRQKRAVEEVFDQRAANGPMQLFLLEHWPPVITVSRRPQAAANVLASEQRLAQLGIEIHQTDRGGDVTYHGPGQVVAYAVLDLERLGLRIHSYMRALEEIVIELLASHGVRAQRDQTATGVWVGGGDSGRETSPSRKICAMGVRVSRWVSMHGLALNVCPDLSHFSCIVPCGLMGRPVTSLRAEMGEAEPDVESVKADLARRFTQMVEQLTQRLPDTDAGSASGVNPEGR
ncbi:MAG: lipoyl(octanoyl) transferase LipB [Phycisphaerales bacterium]|nr:lipoyl(octanoyl) transferase LipB [Phycisphaerales bacterium]